MKLLTLKSLLLFGIIASGCEKGIPVPVSEIANKNTITAKPALPAGEQTNDGVTGNTTPVTNGNGTPNPTIPVIVSPIPPQVSQPQQQFVQQTEGQTAHNLDKPLNSVRQYLAYIPAGYNAQPNTKWPVVIFLHGSAELGNDVNKIFWTYFAWKTMDKKYPYILITPQLLNGNGEWSAADLDKMLDEVLPKYNIDPARVILTGYSLGAHGAWDLAAYKPERFAGVVPVSGWGDANKAYAFKNVPVWAFHGDGDNSVNVSGSINMVNAIKNAGGTKANLTIYQGRGHDVHGTTYDNPDVIKWMLSQKK